MRLKFHYVFIIFCLVFAIACDRPKCDNSNPVFDNFPPDTKQYKDELVKQLKIIDNAKLKYWLDQYQEKDGSEYLYLFVQGDGLCAKMKMTVIQWSKLEDVKRTKGMSYRGAEFKNLKFEISQDSQKTEFVYNDLEKIVD